MSGVTFGSIEARADRVLIIATGPSASGFEGHREALPGVCMIAVKQAIKAAQAHYWITVDPNDRARAMMRNQREGTEYVAAVPDDYATPRARILAHRLPAEPNVTYLHRLTGDLPMKAKPCLSERKDALHTGNSAWGALGLAYHLRPKKIAFVGLDGTQQAHGIGTGAPNSSLAHLPMLFATAIPQLTAHNIRVLNGSPNSAVKCFVRVTREEVLRWIVN